MELGINSGQRNFSPQIAELAKCTTNFSGLPEGISMYDILGLLQFIGHDFGFKEHHIRYLAHSLKFTNQKDWSAEAYHPPVVWQSVRSIAIELNRGERTVRRIEKELHELGAITWKDSGNHKRRGRRDHRDYIEYAYGVDLSPLAFLYHELKAHAEVVIENRDIWKEEVRELSALKRMVLSKFRFAGLSTDEIDELASPEASTPLAEIRRRHAKLLLLELTVDEHFRDSEETIDNEQNVDMSAKGDVDDRHLYITTNLNSSKEDTCNPVDKIKGSDLPSQDAGNLFANAHTSTGFQKKPDVKSRPNQEKNDQESGKASTGIEHLNLKHLLNAATCEFRDHIPLHDRPIVAADIVDAAQIMCHELGINRHAWLEAIAEIGRLPAAVCVLVADKNQYHPDNPVRSPGGFLCGMVDAARNGELQLHRSVFGILERAKFDA